MVHRDPSEGNGQKSDYDHSTSKPVEEAGKGRHGTDDKTDRDEPGGQDK